MSHTRAVLCALVAVLGCSEVSQEFDQAAREIVIAEVQQRLDDYASAVMSNDIDGILSFWGDSLVFAGDGSILGGIADWEPIARADNAQAATWVHWTWENVHILPLAPSAASATLEFRYQKIMIQGHTVGGYGSWTYVLRREDEGWQVVHGNGHHLVR